jgi:TolA-binding protein
LSAGDARFAPYALNHLASIASRRGDFAKAADLLEKAAQRDCGEDLTAGATLQRGMMLMADHRFTEAEAAFTKFLSRYASHPRAAEARTQRAIALSRQNKHQQAIDGMAEIKPTDLADIDPGLRAAVGYEKAWCLRELGRNEDAAKAYRELLEASAGGELPLRAQLELAGLESNAKRWSEAASILRSLRGELRTAPAADADLKEQVTYRLALCESELGNTKEAVELFAEFLGGFPESPLVASASYQAGEALLKLGRYEESAKAFTRVTDRFPDDPLTGPALLRLGDCLASAQRWPASERAFSDYLERFPSAEPWFQAQFGIGWAREHQQRYAEAIDAYQTVVARHKGPTAARAQFQIGECLFAQEKFEDAARELLKVDILYAYAEWSAPALYEAGRCFERLGKGGDARTQFSQVLDQHGGTRWAELASQRLAELSSAAIPPGHSR